MLSNFGRLPREQMVKEHERVLERLELACRLLDAQGEIIKTQRLDIADLKESLNNLKEIKKELYKLEC